MYPSAVKSRGFAGLVTSNDAAATWRQLQPLTEDEKQLLQTSWLRRVMTTQDEEHDVTEKNDYVIVDDGQVSDRPVV